MDKELTGQSRGENASPGEKPLNAGEAFALTLAAALTIGIFYGYVLAATLVLLCILVAEIVILLVATRFGVGRLAMPMVRRNVALLGIFWRSAWQGKWLDLRTPLMREDCPRLYEMLATVCSKAGTGMPDKVMLEMGVNAWVRMKGMRTGRGNTALGVGFDLLAGLTMAEIEAVLAHEMMHAKLVQRGFRQAITRGLNHAARLTGALHAHMNQIRAAKRSDTGTELLLRAAQSLARRAAKQVAASSRQDEFAADRGAAEICGAAPLRSSLLKLEGLEQITARVPLQERAARLESGLGFASWLATELARVEAGDAPKTTSDQDLYATHPSLHDRLAALSTVSQYSGAQDSTPAIALLADPDATAQRLIRVIQEGLRAQEQRDSKALDRWTRRISTGGKLSMLQMLGAALVGLAIILIVVMAMVGSLNWPTGLGLAATAAVGVVLYRIRRYRGRVELPVPDFKLIKQTADSRSKVDTALEKSIEAELVATVAQKRGTKRKGALLSAAMEAVGVCDYLRAHIAARLCTAQDKKSIPAWLIVMVAAGSFKNGQQVSQCFNVIQRRAGIRTPGISWGAGWSLALIGDWAGAEAFLDRARKEMPGEGTVLGVLAICQARRGKLFSAIESAREACAVDPANREYGKLLAELLVDAGFLREASAQIQTLATDGEEDLEFMRAALRMCLMSHDEANANRWMERIRASSAGPEKLVGLGDACREARMDSRAQEFYEEALAAGRYPEALVGLARLEMSRKNREGARRHLAEALDLTKPSAEKSVGSVALAGQALQLMRMLQDTTGGCQAWIASMPRAGVDKALAGISFLVYGRDLGDAKGAITSMLAMMMPATAPVEAAWTPAPKEQQPDGLVHPGVQGVYKL